MAGHDIPRYLNGAIGIRWRVGGRICLEGKLTAVLQVVREPVAADRDGQGTSPGALDV